MIYSFIFYNINATNNITQETIGNNMQILYNLFLWKYLLLLANTDNASLITTVKKLYIQIIEMNKFIPYISFIARIFNKKNICFKFIFKDIKIINLINKIHQDHNNLIPIVKLKNYLNSNVDNVIVLYRLLPQHIRTLCDYNNELHKYTKIILDNIEKHTNTVYKYCCNLQGFSEYKGNNKKDKLLFFFQSLFDLLTL